MKNFFDKVGQFFKKRWPILLTALIAFTLGGVGGFVSGQTAELGANKVTNVRAFEQRMDQQLPERPDRNQSEADAGASSTDGNKTSTDSQTSSSSTDTQAGASSNN